MKIDRPTFIVTAELDQASFQWLNDLRQQHFPSASNYLDAHLTLFHNLNHDAVQILKSTLSANKRNSMSLQFNGFRKLGRGVAIVVTAPELQALRSALSVSVDEYLIPQDRQPFRPHVTVQNKVDQKISDKLYAALSESFVARAGSTNALLVWKYLNGPWQFVERLSLERR